MSDQRCRDRVGHSSIVLRPSSIVIGYGNPLRGDDALGPLAAQMVADWSIPGVQALAVHQLLPELAETLAQVERAIFVDARIREAGEPAGVPVHVQPLAPSGAVSALGHIGDPRALLALTAALYGRYPAAWVIEVPAHNFALGAALSPHAERGLAEALLHVRDLLGTAKLMR